MDFYNYNLDKNKAFLVSLKALIIEGNRLLVLKNTVSVFNEASPPQSSGVSFMVGRLLSCLIPRRRWRGSEARNKKSQWELPGGILEEKEKIEKGLIREVKEETRLNVLIGDVFTVWDHWEERFKLKDGRIFDVRIIEIAFFCQKIGGELQLSDEHSQFKWATKEELKKLDFSPNSKPAIKEYLRIN